MSLIERLEYLHNFPKVLPPVACVFSTQEENFQGFLISYENEEVTIQLPNQTTKTLTVSQLANISMMGIRKE